MLELMLLDAVTDYLSALDALDLYDAETVPNRWHPIIKPSERTFLPTVSLRLGRLACYLLDIDSERLGCVRS